MCRDISGCRVIPFRLGVYIGFLRSIECRIDVSIRLKKSFFGTPKKAPLILGNWETQTMGPLVLHIQEGPCGDTGKTGRNS